MAEPQATAGGFVSNGSSTPRLAMEQQQQQQQQLLLHRLPLVELKGPVFHQGSLWLPGRSLEAAAAAAAAGAAVPVQYAGVGSSGDRTRDLPQLQQQQQQLLTPRTESRRGQAQQQQQQQQQQQLLHREASQITMATVAMARRRRPPENRSIELDGRHLSAIGQRRQVQPPQEPPQQEQHHLQHQLHQQIHTATPASTEPSTATAAFAISGGGGPTVIGYTARVFCDSQQLLQQQQQQQQQQLQQQQASQSLPFVRQHLRRHRTLLELTLGQDRLVVDAFADTPTPAERLTGRMRACAGELTPGQARILEKQQPTPPQRQQQQQQLQIRRRLSRREKTAQTISKAILTYDRSL